jgi:hypothetical protein
MLKKLFVLIKMCLNETHNTLRIGKKSLWEDGVKKGNIFSPQLFDFALEDVVRSEKVNQNGPKLNGTHAFDLCWWR